MGNEKIEAGELQLLNDAVISVSFAETHRDAIWGHLVKRYNLTQLDRLDDKTGEIIRGVKIESEQGEVNGNGASTTGEIGSTGQSKRPDLRVERDGKDSESATGSSS